MAVLPTGIGPVTGGYQIERSLRFNSADSAYLTRTPASAGNRQKFTISFWMKRTTLGALDVFTGNAGNGLFLNFRSDDTMYFYDFGAASGGWQIWSARVFRDVGAWYHIVLAVDSTQATDTNRAKIYINGVQETLSTWTVGGGASRYPSLNANFDWNNTNSHEIGYASNYGYFNGYLTEFYNIDGQQLEPSSFGETDSNTGVWKPKAYTGTYGTNGFYLKFADNSGTTSTTLGKDTSGNGNNWTPNNFSVTAGAGNDSLVDSPTSYGTDTGVGGTVRGNYCTLNPLRNYTSTNGTISNGNLQVNGSQSATNACAAGTMVLSGKMYWEFTITTVGSSPSSGVGILPITYTGSASVANGLSVGIFYLSNGDKRVTGSSSAYGATYSSGDIIGIAVDVTAETITFYKNNTSQGSISGTGIISAGVVPYIGMDDTNSPSITANFGQRAFAYTAPSGFKALCTQNLPTPTIGATSTTQAGKYFNPILYTGDGTAPKSFTGVGFQPDLVWIKARSAAYYHHLTDAVRGANKSLYSNATDAEATSNAVSAFGSDGFTINNTDVNGSGVTYVAWNWNAGGSTVTNTIGTISAQVRANTTSGFSVVTYTGTGANATVGHGLGVAPDMIIVKNRTNAGQFWAVGHSSLTSWANGVYLNSTAAQASATTLFNSTAPTSTVFSVGTSGDTNGSTHNMVAYCFDAVAGYSAFGSYVGNGSTDGPFVYLGFRPEFVMIKRTDSTGNWITYDAVRGTYNVNGPYVYSNSSAAEATSTTVGLDFLSNGFKNRNTYNDANTSSATYIYAAFAEHPFKYSLAR